MALALSITQAIPLFAKNNTQEFRMATAFYFFGGVADLFLSVMLWLIFDQNKTPTVIVDGRREYSVVEVIKFRDSLNSLDCEHLN